MIIKTKYRVYHSDQEGCRHERGSKRFVFGPQYPFRPLGLIIFDPGTALVEQVLVGNQSQLVAAMAAHQFSPLEFTIEQLEMLAGSSLMQSVLNGMGIPCLALPTVSPGTYLTVVVTEPVGIVAFWGIEQDI